MGLSHLHWLGTLSAFETNRSVAWPNLTSDRHPTTFNLGTLHKRFLRRPGLLILFSSIACSNQLCNPRALRPRADSTDTMSSTQASLSAAADDRKSRLAKLKNLKRKQPGDEVAPPESSRSPSAPESPAAASTAADVVEKDVAKLHLSGRNYDAEVRGPKLGFEAAPTQGMEGPTLEEQAAEVEAEAKQKALQEAADADKGIDLFKLQPKKPNWDLKRDLDKKLEVLNVRTDNAIARLVRERIANAKTAEKDKQEQQKTVTGGEGAEAVGLDGVALVEAMRVRERENEEEEKREREEAEAEAED